MLLATGSFNPTVKQHYIFLDDDSPAAELLIQQDRRFAGTLVVQQHAALVIKNATVTVAGDILLADNASIRLAGGRLLLEQEHDSQLHFILQDKAKLLADNAEIIGNNHSLSLTLLDESSCNINNCDFSSAGKLSWNFADSSRAVFAACSGPGSLIIRDSASLDVTDCSDLLCMPFFPSRSEVVLTLPSGERVESYGSGQVVSKSPLSFNFILRDCDSLRWGVGINIDSNININDSRLSLVELAAAGETETEISGLQPVSGKDFRLSFAAGSVSLHNCTVDGWAVSATDEARFTVRDSELLGAAASGKAALTLKNCVFTADSEITLSGESELLGYDSKVDSNIFLDDLTATTFIRSQIRGDIALQRQAFMVLLNCTRSTSTQAGQAADLVEISLPPVQAEAGNIINVKANINTVAGPVAGFRLLDYHLDYAPQDQPDRFTTIAEGDISSKEKHLSLAWDTRSLPPGRYLLRLRVGTSTGFTLSVSSPALLE